MGCGTSSPQPAAAQSGGVATPLTGVPGKPGQAKPAAHKTTPSEIATVVLSKDNVNLLKDKEGSFKLVKELTGLDVVTVTWETATTLGDEVYGKGCDDVEDMAEIARDMATTLLEEALEHASDVTAELVDALQQVPMVGAVFSLMSVIIKRGKGAQANKHNCALLVEHVLSARAVLTAVVQKDAKGTTHMQAAKEDIKKLRKLLARADKLVDACHGKGWLLLMLSAPSDKRRFEELSQLMTQCLSKFQLLAVLQMSSGGFVNQMEDAAAEMRRLTGLDDPVAGLKMLASDPDPARRTQVAKALGSGGVADLAIMDTLADAVAVLNDIAAAQAAMAKQLDTIGGQVTDISSGIQMLLENQRLQAASRDITAGQIAVIGGKLEQLLVLQQAKDTNTSSGLPPYLRLFWEGAAALEKHARRSRAPSLCGLWWIGSRRAGPFLILTALTRCS